MSGTAIANIKKPTGYTRTLHSVGQQGIPPLLVLYGWQVREPPSTTAGTGVRELPCIHFKANQDISLAFKF